MADITTKIHADSFIMAHFRLFDSFSFFIRGQFIGLLLDGKYPLAPSHSLLMAKHVHFIKRLSIFAAE
jgi:hypothetical protein